MVLALDAANGDVDPVEVGIIVEFAWVELAG